MRAGDVRGPDAFEGVAQRQRFEGGAHLGDFDHRRRIERRDPHAAARHALHQAARLEPAKGLAHRYMAGAELGRDMVLAQAGAGRDRAGDDALRQRLRDPADQGPVALFFYRRGYRLHPGPPPAFIDYL
jgi:hypothetical protein